MWETSGWKDEDLLWASMALYGGIAGQQSGPCGAISSSAVYVGLRHRRSMDDKEAVSKARLDIEREALQLAKEFASEFGTLTCLDLVGLDLSDPVVRKRFRDENISKEKCDRYMEFVIDKLYELEETRSAKSE